MARERKTTSKTESTAESDEDWDLFEAEALYAESQFRLALNDAEGSIAAIERACEIKPDYAPAILSLGSVEYQRNREKKGYLLFRSLIKLPDVRGDLAVILDRAGDFLIDIQNYKDGLALYKLAVRRFPEVAVLYQGLACCAGHQKEFDLAIEASEKAVELEPDRAVFVSDLGWTLLLTGRLDEAEKLMLKALELDPSHKRTQANLGYCRSLKAKRK